MIVDSQIWDETQHTAVSHDMCETPDIPVSQSPIETQEGNVSHGCPETQKECAGVTQTEE